MTSYGKNLLPAFSTTDWQLGSSHSESISNGYFNCKRYGQAEYDLNVQTTDTAGNPVYYNIGDAIKISWSNATARFTLNILYWDADTGEGFNCAVNMPVGSGSAEITLQTATIGYIKFIVYRIDNIGESNSDTILHIGTVKAQFQSTPNTSGETSTATLSGGGTGTDNTDISANVVFAGPSSGTRGRAGWRALVRKDGATGYDNTAITPNQVYAGPSSGSNSGNAVFRSLVRKDGATGYDNTDIAPNAIYAGPSSGSSNGNATFRVLAMADMPFSSTYPLGRAYGGLGVDATSIDANKVFAGPSSGFASSATFRSLTFADLPLGLVTGFYDNGTLTLTVH